MAATSNQERPELKRSIGVIAATGSGLAVIIGAGVYVLMGEAAAKSGNAIWASFLLAAGAAFFTALSYAELSAKFPRAASGYNYAREAFGDGAAFVVGWLTFFSQVVSVATVALGFAGYLRDQAGFPVLAGGLSLLAASTLFSLRGVKESTTVGAALSMLEVLGLAVIIGVGVSFLGNVDYLESPEGAWGIFGGAFLLFFAFLGFEQVADLAGEIKNPGRNLPIAVMASGGIAAVLYIITALASVSIIGWKELSESEAPLAAVAQEAMGEGGYYALSVIALIATASTVLISLTATVRTVYGMAKGGSLPMVLAKVHRKYATPWAATLAVAAVATLGVLSQDVGFVAEITNFTILLVFIGVNLSHIVLRRRLDSQEWPFRVGLKALGVPVTPVLGVVVSALLLVNVRLAPALWGLGIMGIGIGVAVWQARKKG
ncbi:MAG: amino acid permease [SAR202 cluster bacterium]|nr:amino acid permease [SAR202 cluster bacterium]